MDGLVRRFDRPPLWLNDEPLRKMIVIGRIRFTVYRTQYSRVYGFKIEVS